MTMSFRTVVLVSLSLFSDVLRVNADHSDHVGADRIREEVIRPTHESWSQSRFIVNGSTTDPPHGNPGLWRLLLRGSISMPPLPGSFL